MRALSIWLAVGCAPPPAIDAADSDAPSIRILYPEPGQEIELDADCALTVPIVVDIRGIELVSSEVNAPGEGHWHGGPDLAEGYCMAFGPSCEGRAGEPERDELAYERYDGRSRSGGLLTLRAELQTNRHEPLPDARDQVEVLLLAPAGGFCP
jgi:hypothetical protein